MSSELGSGGSVRDVRGIVHFSEPACETSDSSDGGECSISSSSWAGFSSSSSLSGKGGFTSGREFVKRINIRRQSALITSRTTTTLQRAFSPEGLVKREDLFIVSKLWQTFHEREQVEPICRKQLADWGIDYFDLYVIHFPVALKYVDPKERYPPGWFVDGKSKIEHSNASLQSTWEAFEELKNKGLAKSIGVSNYSGALLLDMFTYAKIKPATLQIEHHPYYVQPYLIELAKQHDIKVTAYSSFGPQSFIECDMKIAADTPLLFDHPVIKKISEAHGKTPAQVLLRWSTQRGLSVIPKSNSANRLQQNLDVTSFDLKDSEIEEISGLDKNLKFNAPTNYGIPCYVFA